MSLFRVTFDQRALTTTLRALRGLARDVPHCRRWCLRPGGGRVLSTGYGLKGKGTMGDNSERLIMPDEAAIEIVVPPDMQTGVFADLASVTSQTPHAVTVDFSQVVPGDTPQAIVVARLKLAPSFLMPLMQVLSQHLARFEEQMKKADEDHPEEGGGL